MDRSGPATATDTLTHEALVGAVIRRLLPQHVDDLVAWRYPPPFELYNAVDDETERLEMADPIFPYYGLVGPGGLLGFYCFGPPTQVGAPPPPEVYTPGPLDIGLGLRPSLTGRGLGLPFLRAGLAFARERFAPPGFRLTVAAFNHRAITVYERAGFRAVSTIEAPTRLGALPFVVMTT